MNLKTNYCLRRIAEILTNPFYCGMMVHKALEVDVLEGRREKLISNETFLKVNGILAEKKLGLQTKKERPEIALKRFMKCDERQLPMRGYIIKDTDTTYYKCNTPNCNCNRNANVLNGLFVERFNGFKVSGKCYKLIDLKLKHTFNQMNASINENQSAEQQSLIKKLSALRNDLYWKR